MSDPTRDALRACLADFDREPPEWFVDDWVPRLRAALSTSPAHLDVERLARALHRVGNVLNMEGDCNNVEDADCLGARFHEQDATAIAREYAKP